MEVAARHGTCAGAQAEARRPTRPRRAPHAAADRRRSGKGGPGRRAPPTPPTTSHHLPPTREADEAADALGQRQALEVRWQLDLDDASQALQHHGGGREGGERSATTTNGRPRASSGNSHRACAVGRGRAGGGAWRARARAQRPSPVPLRSGRAFP